MNEDTSLSGLAVLNEHISEITESVENTEGQTATKSHAEKICVSEEANNDKIDIAKGSSGENSNEKSPTVGVNTALTHVDKPNENT